MPVCNSWGGEVALACVQYPHWLTRALHEADACFHQYQLTPWMEVPGGVRADLEVTSTLHQIVDRQAHIRAGDTCTTPTSGCDAAGWRRLDEACPRGRKNHETDGKRKKPTRHKAHTRSTADGHVRDRRARYALPVEVSTETLDFLGSWHSIPEYSWFRYRSYLTIMPDEIMQKNICNMQLKLLTLATALFSALMLMVVRAEGQVPKQIEAELRDLGTIIDPITVAALYRPKQETPPYVGATVARDVSYGTDARNVLDVFTPHNGHSHRTVLIFLPGGLGDKIETYPNGEAFYDNVMLWAAKHGMVGVNVQRRGAFRGDINGEDVGTAVRWIHGHIARLGGDPNRMFI